MKHCLKVSYFFTLLLLSESYLLRESYFMNRFNIESYEPMSIEETIEWLKEAEKEKKMKIKEENEDKIYRQYLANRIQSSIVRDFLTMRY